MIIVVINCLHGTFSCHNTLTDYRCVCRPTGGRHNSTLECLFVCLFNSMPFFVITNVFLFLCVVSCKEYGSRRSVRDLKSET